MNRIRGRRNGRWRSPTAVGSVGPPPKIAIEGTLLVLRWTKEEVAQTMDAAGMTLDRVIAKYLLPAAFAIKTIYVKHRGQITERREVPDLRATFGAMKLVAELQCEWIPRRNGPVNRSDICELVHAWPTPDQFEREFSKRMKPALCGPRPPVRSTGSTKQKKTDRAGKPEKRIGPAKAVESVGPRPEITIEGNFLALRWTKEEAARVIDAGGMTLERVVADYLVPAADATKTIDIKYRGQITERREVPDLRARFRAMRLMLELQCEWVPRGNARPPKPPPEVNALMGSGPAP